MKVYFPKVYVQKVHVLKVYFPKVYFLKVYFSKKYFPKMCCKYASILGPNFQPRLFQTERIRRLAHLPSFCELVHPFLPQFFRNNIFCDPKLTRPKLFQTERTRQLAHLLSFCELVYDVTRCMCFVFSGVTRYYVHVFCIS